MTRDKVSDQPAHWQNYKYTKNMSEPIGKSTEKLTASQHSDGHGAEQAVSTVFGTIGYADGGGGIEKEEYVVYKRRWYVLATLAVLNFSNAMVSNNVKAIGPCM